MAKARPTFLSPIPKNTDLLTAGVGVQMLGMNLTPQGHNVAGVMNARDRKNEPKYRTVVVQLPRRATKSTSIWADLLGRCELIPGYQVVITAQDGNRARQSWRGVARQLARDKWEDAYPGNKIRWSNGDEAFEWDNGSRLWVVPPNSSAFRGTAADVIWFDEAGELSADTSEDLKAGALPIMDTRDGGQVIISGTPGKSRSGLLWETLVNGRTKKAGVGIVDYSIRDDEASVIVQDDGTVKLNWPVMYRVHPGIDLKLPTGGVLTPKRVIQERFDSMQLPQFEMEYMCRWPADNTTYAIDPDKWAKGLTVRPPLPDRVGIAFDCASDGSSASMAYAWRDDQGNAYLDVVAHQPGTLWVPRDVDKARRAYPRVPVGYDGIGANLDPASAIARNTRGVKFERMQMREIAAATQRLVSLVSDGKVRHFGQADLDAAVDNVTFRDLAGGRAFRQRVVGGAAINPLVAASIALWTYDKGRDRQKVAIVA